MTSIFKIEMTPNYYYVLDGKVPRLASSFEEWCREHEKLDKRRVGITTISDDCFVSTIFLGVDHSHTKDAPPLLFESLVFGGPCDQDMERCSTWEEAEKQHADLVKRCMETIDVLS